MLTLYDMGGIKIQNLNLYGPGTTAGSYFNGISFVDTGIVTSARMGGITIDQVDVGYSSRFGHHVLFADPGLRGL